MRHLLLLSLSMMLTAALSAQDNLVFPRFSVTAALSSANFDTNARIDPEIAIQEGTLVSFERDLGLEDSGNIQRFGLQWRPFRKHELSAAYFSAPRAGFEQIHREIVFRNERYPVNADVTTQFDLDSLTLTYTYWARRTERNGLGIVLGLAALSIDASVTAVEQSGSVTVTEEARTDVPVALAGLQGRAAFGSRLVAEAGVAMLPRVTIKDYTGDALTAMARVEYRPVSWLGLGGAYHYFRLDVDVDQFDLQGSLDLTMQGPEAYVRVSF